MPHSSFIEHFVCTGLCGQYHIIGNHKSEVNQIIAYLVGRFSIKNLENLNFFLRVKVLRTAKGITISQSNYINEIFTDNNMKDYNSVKTPMSATEWLTAMVVHRGDNPNGNLVEHRDSFASWFLSRSLQGTLQFALNIHRGNDFKLHIYSDVEWDGDVIDQASITGYILFFGQNPMSWSSRKQRTIAHSSTGAKCRVVASTLAETNWVTNLLKELYVSLYQRPTIYYDNIGATYLCGNPVFHSRMKNIIVDFHFVHKQVQQFTLFIFLL
ncbi:hypothetical protein FXO38_28733 [Capsicum annuum]|nr:hypothetical protein FXO38_28733 [Capsicum annuum]